jgi:hypothetical protein
MQKIGGFQARTAWERIARSAGIARETGGFAVGLLNSTAEASKTTWRGRWEKPGAKVFIPANLNFSANYSTLLRHFPALLHGKPSG